MLRQFACSLARARRRQLCKSDMSLASTRHHVTITRERHELALCTQQHTPHHLILHHCQPLSGGIVITRAGWLACLLVRHTHCDIMKSTV